MPPVIGDFKYIRLPKPDTTDWPPFNAEDLATDSRRLHDWRAEIPAHISAEERQRILLETARAERGLYIVPHLRIYNTDADSLAVRYNDLGIGCFDYDPAKAQRHFRTAIRLDRSCALAHNNLGLALIESGDLDQAHIHLEEAVHLDPGMDTAYNNRGLCRLEQGAHGKAFDDFNRAMQLVPNDPIYWNNLGIVFLDLGKPEMAIDLFDQAMHLNDTIPMIYGNRGLAHKMMGDWTAANRDFDTAFRLDETQNADAADGA